MKKLINKNNCKYFKIGGNIYKIPKRITGGNILQSIKRIDWNKFNHSLNNNRAFNLKHLKQLEEAMINANFGEALRLAILATALQEAGDKGFYSKGIGGNGIIGLSSGRMNVDLLAPGKEQDLIDFIINDLQTTHSNNWLDGGTGGIFIKNGKEAFDKFWNSTDPYETTQILNKSYIRPAARETDWNIRALIALELLNLLI